VSEHERARLERALARQSLIHHRKREEELERLLADLFASPEKNCRCRSCKALRALRAELEEEGTWPSRP
jgi:hypothetical protein